jgi:hypothetical protein
MVAAILIGAILPMALPEDLIAASTRNCIAVSAKRDDRPGNYRGEVTAVDELSVTIKGKEESSKNVEVTRAFPAGPSLRGGKQDPHEASSIDYLLSDVKVGDKVFVIIHQMGEDDVCVAVRILRRPGGIVPKAPFEDRNVKIPHHVRMNAFQAFEEKGTPLPPDLDPKVLKERYAKAEFAEKQRRDLLKLRDEGRIAPMPRPVIRK